MERHDRRRTWAKAAVPLIIAAGFAFARTGAAQDPPAPIPEPSAAPPAPTEPAPPPTPDPVPAPTATEAPYPDEPPAPPAPVPAPTATTPPPAPSPTTPSPTAAPTATGYPPAHPPARTAQPTYPPPPARTSPPPPAPTARTPVAEPAPVVSPRSDEGPKKDDEDDTDGLFGPFRIGPVIGVGLPSVLSFGGTVKLTRFLGGGITIGMIPTIKVSYYGEATVSYQHYEAYGRLYPFGGAFFLGAGVGYATIKGSLKNSYDSPVAIPGYPSSFPIESEASVRTMMLSPTLGFFHTFGSGFSIGIEGGAQVPIAPSEITFNTNVPTMPDPTIQTQVNSFIDKNDKDVRDQLEKMGQTILPTFGIKIGWLL